MMSLLNNIKVKYKLFIIYFLCIVAPIISINIIFYQSTASNVREIQKNYYQLSTQRIVTQITNNFNFLGSLSTKISLDQNFYEMLDKHYETELDYVSAYYDYFDSYIYFSGESYKSINKMMVYTDNPTIMQSSRVLKIDDEVKKKPWYEKVVNNPDKLHVVYGESRRSSDNSIVTPVSIVKVLNEFHGLNRYMKILKTDLYLNNIVEIISSQSNRGDIFITDNKARILFAFNDISEGENLDVFLNDSGRNSIRDNIDNYLDWQVVNVINENDLEQALQEPRNNIISLTLLSLFLSSFIIFLFYRSFYIRLNNLYEHVIHLDHDDFSKQYSGVQGKDEIGSLIKAYNNMVKKIKTLVMDVYEAKLVQYNIKLGKKQAEINSLQSQMDPHFLFNTLESIRMKSLEKGEKETAQIIKYLARSFRRMISFDQEWITVSRELIYIKDFLKIQKYRFGNEFEYEINVDFEAENIKVPKLIIQPFVENACIHGIEGSEDIGKVSVNISLNPEKQKLKCVVKDNGVGIEKEKLNNLMRSIKKNKSGVENIGIANIYKRLKLYYEDDFELMINSREGKGTKIELKIPVEV